MSSAAGTETGDTKLTVTPTKEEGNVYKIKIGDAETEVEYDQNVKNWTAWDGESDITVEAGKTITVVEATADYKVRKAGSVAAVTE